LSGWLGLSFFINNLCTHLKGQSAVYSAFSGTLHSPDNEFYFSGKHLIEGDYLCEIEETEKLLKPKLALLVLLLFTYQRLSKTTNDNNVPNIDSNGLNG
jgi:hypothetical protein